MCVSVYAVYACPVATKARRGYSFEYQLLPDMCWEPKSGPLREPHVLLTAEPSLQPLFCFVLEAESHVSQASLDLAVWPRITSN